MWYQERWGAFAKRKSLFYNFYYAPRSVLLAAQRARALASLIC